MKVIDIFKKPKQKLNSHDFTNKTILSKLVEYGIRPCDVCDTDVVGESMLRIFTEKEFTISHEFSYSYQDLQEMLNRVTTINTANTITTPTYIYTGNNSLWYNYTSDWSHS